MCSGPHKCTTLTTGRKRDRQKPNRKLRFFLQNLPKPTDSKLFETVTTLILGLDFFLVFYLGFIFCEFFHVSLGRFVLILLASVLLGLVSSVISQEIVGKNVLLRSNLFYVKWDMKPLLKLITHCRVASVSSFLFRQRCLSVCLLVKFVSPAETAELIGMPTGW